MQFYHICLGEGLRIILMFYMAAFWSRTRGCSSVYIKCRKESVLYAFIKSSKQLLAVRTLCNYRTSV